MFEIFSLVANEEYRFPVLEVFAALFALGTLVLAGLFGSTGHFAGTDEGAAFALVNSLTGLPVLVLVVLMLKNIAYGLGNDLESGIIRTYLSYPLGRSRLLTARLLSSILVPLVLFLGISLFALDITSTETILSHPVPVALSYLGVLCYPLLIVGLALLLTLWMRKGGPALLAGILLYFASGILSTLLGFLGAALDSGLPLRIFALIRPDIALQRHYTTGMFAEELWVPTLGEAVIYTFLGYVLVVIVYLMGYIYFSRRLET
jgi:ABC-type transport system involved in multi-copper enzyme maturation permease subunit